MTILIGEGQEAYINWNAPPVVKATTVGEKTLDMRFGGRHNWRFVTKKNKEELYPVSRLKKEKSWLPFF